MYIFDFSNFFVIEKEKNKRGKNISFETLLINIKKSAVFLQYKRPIAALTNPKYKS